MGKASRAKKNRPRGSARELAEVASSYLNLFNSRIPGIFSVLEEVRDKNIGNVFWPDWCYLPMSAVQSCVQQDGKETAAVPLLSAVLAWKQTKGIYRIDPELARSLEDTPMEKLPVEILYQMPEWGIFVEVEEKKFFAWLEYDLNKTQPELRFVFLRENGLWPDFLPLTQETLKNAISISREQSLNWMRKVAQEMWDETTRPQPKNPLDLDLTAVTQEFITPFVSVLVYICSQKADIVNPDNPKIKPSKTPKPSDNPRVWEVGYRIGTALKQARLNEEPRQDDRGSHQKPRAHIRRAHWHHYWVGALESKDRHLEVRWIPPVGVNLDLEADLPVVIRDVK